METVPLSTTRPSDVPDSSNPGSARGHIQAIDGLRALAVLSVIAFHLFPRALPGGYAGVDIFFVISGYVVTMSLYKQPVESFAAFLSSFYVRRIARIYPALITCLVLVGILTALFIPRSFLSNATPWTGLFAFVGAGNIALIQFNDGYFSPTFEYNPYGHTWSLGVEEQFYLLYPILVFLWLRKKARGTALSWEACTIGFLCVASLAFSAWQTHVNHDRAYYLLPSRFWELGVGASLYLCHAHRTLIPKGPRMASLLAAIGLAMMFLCLVVADNRLFPFPWAIAAVAGSATFMSAASTGGPLVRFFGSAPATYIGRLSYSLYLWHFPAIVLFRWTVGLGSAWELALAVALGVIPALLSYHFVEPFGRSLITKKGRSTGRALLVGLSTILVGVACWALVFVGQKRISLSVTANHGDWYSKVLPTGKILDGPPGKELSGKRLYVLGDSHAVAYSDMLQAASDETGLSIELLNQSGCSIANLIRPLDYDGPSCVAYAKRSVDKVFKEARPGDAVFIASLRMNRLADQWATYDIAQIVRDQMSQAGSENRTVALREADQLVSQLENRGIKVLIDAPMPVFQAPPFRCADWFDKMNPICAAGFSVKRSFLVDFRRPVMESINKLQSMHKALFVWDSFDALCPGAECSAFDNGKPLFFDCDHLSGYGDRLLVPSFVKALHHVFGVPG